MMAQCIIMVIPLPHHRNILVISYPGDLILILRSRALEPPKNFAKGSLVTTRRLKYGSMLGVKDFVILATCCFKDCYKLFPKFPDL